MSEDDIKQIKNDLRDVRNDIEKIQSDTSSLNRIIVLANTEYIVKDIINIVENSNRTAIIPVLLEEPKTITEIAKLMGIYETNTYRYLRRFIKKNYIYTIKKENKTYYVKSELLDLIQYKNIEEVDKLIKEWQSENKR